MDANIQLFSGSVLNLFRDNLINISLTLMFYSVIVVMRETLCFIFRYWRVILNPVFAPYLPKVQNIYCHVPKKMFTSVRKEDH